MKVLGIHGKAGAGKDTLADMIIKNSDEEWVKYSFAQPLKDTVNKMFGWGWEHSHGILKEEKCLAAYAYETADRIVSENIVPILDSNIDLPAEDIVSLFEIALNKHQDFDVFELSGGGRLDVAVYGAPRVAYQIFGTEVMRSIQEDFWIKAAQHFVENCDANVIIPDVRFENEAEFVWKNGKLVHIIRPDNTLDVGQHASEAGIKEDQRDIFVYNAGSLEELESMQRVLFNDKRLWETK